MNRNLNIALVFTPAILVLSMQCATAQQLRVATGTAKGTYNTELKEMRDQCGQEIPLVGIETSGAVENLELLTGNKVNMAFAQSDLLYRRSRTQDLGDIRTLLALHKEQLHFVALSNLEREIDSGSMFSRNKKERVTNVGQIGGLRLAAGGGAVETAKQFRTDSEVNYKLLEAKDADAALAALTAKDADARADVALLVGGAPLGNLGTLGKEYTILSVPGITADGSVLSGSVAERVKGAYRYDKKYSRLTYSKMGVQGVPTVSVDALLVTREYTTPKMIDALGRFRQCVLSKIGEIKETTGTHPAWQSVDPNNHGTWTWYNLPTAAK